MILNLYLHSLKLKRKQFFCQFEPDETYPEQRNSQGSYEFLKLADFEKYFAQSGEMGQMEAHTTHKKAPI